MLQQLDSMVVGHFFYDPIPDSAEQVRHYGVTLLDARSP